MTTRAGYYIQTRGGKWRKARVEHRCDWKTDGFRCTAHITPGDEYFDTNVPNPQSSNPHGTYRICEGHAKEEVF